MSTKTTENLKAAFAGESQAYMKYMAFAEKARKDGFRNVARLFTGIAFAERVHALNHHQVLTGGDATVRNLDVAIGGENHEVRDMYPAFLASAEEEGQKRAAQSMRYALEAEKIHAVMYENAKKAVVSGQDSALGDLFVCEVCGHTVEGEAPDTCPVCSARKEKYRQF
jgi:rubrerythrin